MSKIDVSKCAFYNNGKCNNPNGMACNCCNNAYCYYKQLQQAIKDRDYYKQIVDGCKSESGNCSFCEIDKQLQQANKTIASQKGIIKKFVESEQQLKAENELLKNERTIDLRNQLEQLKAENEELKENLAINKDVFNSICVEKYKLEKCLDEIEEICKLSLHCDSCYEILQLIKQAKEGE